MLFLSCDFRSRGGKQTGVKLAISDTGTVLRSELLKIQCVPRAGIIHVTRGGGSPASMSETRVVDWVGILSSLPVGMLLPAKHLL